MFGYIKPYRPELKLRELEEYKAVYCGLCKELGRSYGIFARFTLSYDFAFLAMVLTSLDGNACPSLEKCRCIAHPFKKQCRCAGNEAIGLSATAAIILTYYQLLDDISDRGFFKRLAASFMLPFAKRARKKALAQGGEASALDEAAKTMTEEQRALEAEKCEVSDRAAEPTAKFLSAVLDITAKDGAQKRVLERFGYLLGRYIYLCDALDDIDDDVKKGNYNPFIYGGENAAESAKAALFLTTAELESDLSLLELNKYKGIIENIVCLGLRAEVERIIQKKGGTGLGA